jgi:fucose 4-O-acetylase-like acetyltransferase
MSGERAASAQRYEWVDAARGIGILAVVLGHVWTGGEIRSLVYTFHMPLFFLLSGYLFRPKPPFSFARRLIVTQGLSYVVFLALLVVVDTLIEGSRGHRGIFHTWPRDIATLAYGGSKLRGPFTVFWFIPCLIVARILFNAFYARFPALLGKGWWAIAAVSLVLAYWLGEKTDVSPLGLLTLPMALVLLWAGAVWSGVTWQRQWLWLLVPLSLAGLMLFPTLNMKAGDYGWPLASIAGAIATSFLIFRIARLRPFLSAPLRALGRASLVIMYLHVPVIHYLSPVGKPMLILLAVLIPLAVYYLLGRSKVTRTIFLAR